MARTLRVRPPAGLSHPSWTPAADRLRLSVTDACNYTCSFCHNEGSLQTQVRFRNQLKLGDARFYVRAAVVAGIRAVKLTGGEPLIYRQNSHDIAELTNAVCEEAAGRATVSITTNGQLLEQHARSLAQTNLSHIAVSVHTLDSVLFRREISNSGSPRRQLAGIQAASQAGIHVKANVVVLPDMLEGVLDLCESLFAVGAMQIRLYRALWSPLDSAPEDRRVSDADLISLAAQASGLPSNAEVLDYASNFLQSGAFGLPRSLSFDGPAGTVELDRMPTSSSVAGPQDEGDYAVRVSAVGDLHARLFSESETIAHLSAKGDLVEAARRISSARRELAVLG